MSNEMRIMSQYSVLYVEMLDKLCACLDDEPTFSRAMLDLKSRTKYVKTKIINTFKLPTLQREL